MKKPQTKKPEPKQSLRGKKITKEDDKAKAKPTPKGKKAPVEPKEASQSSKKSNESS
jgi:hypothetical protein